MFRKLTTIVDSKLVRELGQNNKSLVQTPGFRECMAFATTMVISASELSEAHRGHNVMDQKHLPLDNPEDTGAKLCHVIFGSQRLEAVIKLFTPGFFLWELFAYRTGEKAPFYRACFQVSHDGSFHCGYGTPEMYQ